VGVLTGTKNGDGSISWSSVSDGPAIEVVSVTDPDTGAPVRDGDPLISVAKDSHGNLYAVWADARFSSKFTVDGIAFSMSTNGGQTWSDPIKINQTPTSIPAGDQQAFTPTVAVNTDGTVAVTYYDFRNNDASPGLLTDYWLVHASDHFTNPTSWASDEKRLTSAADGVTGQPFNIENAAPTSRGLFLGDYEGLAAVGSSFYAFFAQAGSSTADPSNIWFRDPPPAPGVAEASPTLAEAPPAVEHAEGVGTLAPVSPAAVVVTPSVALPAGTPAGGVTFSQTYGFLAGWGELTGPAAIPAGESRPTASTSPDVRAIDLTFAAGALGNEDGTDADVWSTPKAEAATAGSQESEPLADAALADVSFGS
jgi:hypothetical protein